MGKIINLLSLIPTFFSLLLGGECLNYLISYIKLDAAAREIGHLISLKGGVNKDVEIYLQHNSFTLSAQDGSSLSVGEIFTFELKSPYSSLLFPYQLDEFISVTRNVIIGLY